MNRLFISVTVILTIVFLLGGLFFFFYKGELSWLLQIILLLAGLFFLFLVLALILFLVGIKLINRGYQPLWLLKLVFWELRLFFPFLLLAGRFRREYRMEIQRDFIKLNNLLIEKLFLTQKKEFSSVMILLPHCLQWSDCPLKITYNVENCKNCGKCDIGALLDLAHQYNLKMFVATGGTLARRIIKENRPQFIVACACEEDLSLGIFDVRKIPVYGVLNERPFGPCFNTKISVEKVREVLEKLYS